MKQLFSVVAASRSTGFLINPFHRQFDFTAIIKANDLDLDHIAFLANTRGLFGAAILQFRNMHHPSFDQEIHKGAKINRFDHFAIIDNAKFRFATISRIRATAASPDGPLTAATLTVPSSRYQSSPVSSHISRMILPPGPIISRILSTGIFNVVIFGALSARSYAHWLAPWPFRQGYESAVTGLFKGNAHNFRGD
ncbi:MAG: hypothetical protein CM15mP46_1040 [Alphaproteobacteria bacterium]|nr:MAG: hypothetical protein CM15mP46_1040 [Alphaproteobacteria bacterium]